MYKNNIKKLATLLLGGVFVFGALFAAQSFDAQTVEAQGTGSIRVCKVIVDEHGNITNGSERPGAEFSIDSFTPSPDPITSGGAVSADGEFGSATFTTPLNLNTSLFGGEGSDAECITFSGLEPGDYFYDQEYIAESEGWDQPLYHDGLNSVASSLGELIPYSGELFQSGSDPTDQRKQIADGHIVLQDGGSRTLVVLNKMVEIPGINVVAHKVVCEAEEYLPNWGAGSSDITASTAQNWVDNSDGKCWFEQDWDFEWSQQQDVNPGDDLVGSAGGSWVTFGPTDANGKAEVFIKDEITGSRLEFREVLKDGYIPFSYGANGNVNDDNIPSAEFYCYNDVLNYDNWDWINNPQSGETYYCVAFNVEVEGEEPQDPTMCDFDGQSGWYGEYFNYSKNHADMNLPQNQWPDKTHGDPLSGLVSWATDWYNKNLYFKFAQVDSNLTFGENFFPFDSTSFEVKEGDSHDYHFGVHWAAKAEVPADGTYQFTLKSDDDAWVYIDGELVGDNSGIHAPSQIVFSESLTAGEHVFDIFFAERHVTQSHMNFTSNPGLDFMPFNNECPAPPVQCEDDITTQTLVSDITTTYNSNPAVLVGGPFHASWTAAISGASWIWGEHPVADPVNDSTETFVKTFNIAGTPTGGKLEIATDNSYSVILNGEELCKDETEFNFTAAGQDVCVIPAEMFNNGLNTIQFTVKNWAQSGGTQATNPAGLLYKLTFEENACIPEAPEDPEPEAEINVVATKIVCNSESLLPNWGNGGPAIGASTAADFLANKGDNCWLEEGWNFEWANSSTANTGDNSGEIGGQWTKFGPTDENGVASINILLSDIEGEYIWMREVTQNGYVPFAGVGGNDVSSEFYCHVDVLNYDNYDRIDNVADGQAYYCVGFNALEADDPQDPPVTPEDPEVLGCTNSSAENYNPLATKDDDSCEFDDDNNGGGGGGGSTNSGGGFFIDNSQGEVLGESTDAMCGLYLLEYIKYGVLNNPAEVRKLQIFLNENMGANLPITGVYDLNTMNWLSQFQVKYKENVLRPWVQEGMHDNENEPTGYVYKTTKNWINHLKCPSLNLPFPDLLEDKMLLSSIGSLQQLDGQVLGEETANDNQPAQQEQIDLQENSSVDGTQVQQSQELTTQEDGNQNAQGGNNIAIAAIVLLAVVGLIVFLVRR